MEATVSNSKSLESACKTGDVESVKATIQAGKTEFNANVFIQEVFAIAREVIDASVSTYTDGDGKCNWLNIQSFPAPDPAVNAAIELVLEEYVGSINSEMAGSILVYSCCTHIDLVPVVIKLFKDRLTLDHIMDSIYACETRYPDTCWLIMAQCIDQLLGGFGKCFSICCEQNNVSVLKLLIDRHHAKFEETVREYAGHFLDIDDGISDCCVRTDLEIVRLLATRCKFLSYRLLWACVLHENLPAAKLVFNECKEFLTAKPLDAFQEEEWSSIEKAFEMAARNKDSSMLELFIDELGENLSCKAKKSAFMGSCMMNNALSGKMLLDRCSIDLSF